jgi:hypothetical protein
MRLRMSERIATLKWMLVIRRTRLRTSLRRRATTRISTTKKTLAEDFDSSDQLAGTMQPGCTAHGPLLLGFMLPTPVPHGHNNWSQFTPLIG